MANPLNGPKGPVPSLVPVGANGPAGVSMSSSVCLLKFEYEDMGWLKLNANLDMSHATVDLLPNSKYAPSGWEKRMESVRFRQIFQISFVDDYLKFSNIEETGKLNSFELHGDKPTIKQARAVKKRILEVMEYTGLLEGLWEAREKFREEPLKKFLTDVVRILRTAEVVNS